MKVYINGCSHTYGKDLLDPHKSRYSRLLCNELGAEEYNFAASGGSNRRIVRMLLDTNLKDYDLFIIQMTKRLRTECYDVKNKDKIDNPLVSGKSPWQRVRYPCTLTGNNDFWEQYYRHIYDDHFGILDEKMYYTLIRSYLEDVPHVILWIGDYDFNLPVDLVYKKGSLPREKGKHPNESAHEIICDDILRHLTIPK